MASIQLLRRAPPTPPAPPPPSPARGKLALRNAELATLEARREALETAWARTNRETREARERRAGANERIAAALRAASDFAVASILDPSNVAAPPQTIGDVRAAEQALDDCIEVGEQLCASLSAEALAVPARVAFVRSIRDELARAVLREEGAAAIAALFERIHAAHREALDAGLALEALIAAGIIADRGPDAYPDAMELRYRIDFGRWAIAQLPDASPTAAAWRSAFEALKADATAPVPVL